MGLHPLLESAAEGDMPSWARVSRDRMGHIERVAALMGEWAKGAGLAKRDRKRWRAAGFLHDALKGVKPKALRKAVPEELRVLPGPVLHGPAVAAKLREEGVEDESVLTAVAWHSLGHPDLDELGLALYVADFLEPGRKLRPRWRASLRDRMPAELEPVTREILRARIEHLMERDRPVRPETMAFWNQMVGGEAWVHASGP